MESVAFLKAVWGDRECWVDIPSKIRGHWIPYAIEWPDPDLAGLRIQGTKGGGKWPENVYFSVAQFKGRGRRIQDTLPSHWLWADLDKVDPQWAAENGLEPTLAWESSPDRFQALWRMNRELKPKALSKLNRMLTYWLHADRGGWDLTQVLRIPGTRNWKYKGGPEVQIVHDGGPTYDPGDVLAIVRGGSTLDPRTPTRKERRTAQVAEQLPARAKALLRVRPEMVVEGERSSRLWELECLLAEAGLSEDGIYDLTVGTPWNKWAGQATGERRLREDIRKAIRHVSKSAAVNGGKAPARAKKTRVAGVVTTEEIESGDEVIDLTEGEEEDDYQEFDPPLVWFDELMTQRFEEPQWLVKGIWMADSNGIIGGDPKSSKTFLGMALALSVSTGMPFLGEYPVEPEMVGPAIMIQEENSPWDVKDKLSKLATYLGLGGEVKGGNDDRPTIQFPYEFDLGIVNNAGFDMGMEECQYWLEGQLQEIQPKLVVLDPLYLMLGDADENNASQLRPYLKWLLRLRHTYSCSIVIAHHFRKSASAGRTGHRLMGSNAFYGWIDSAMYCETLEPEDDWNRVIKVEREFRSSAPQVPIEVKMRIGEWGDDDLEIEAEDWNSEMVDFPADGGGARTYSQMKQVFRLLEQQGVMTQPEIAEELQMSSTSVNRCLRELRNSGKVDRSEKGGRGRGNAYKWYANGNAS